MRCYLGADLDLLASSAAGEALVKGRLDCSIIESVGPNPVLPTSNVVGRYNRRDGTQCVIAEQLRRLVSVPRRASALAPLRIILDPPLPLPETNGKINTSRRGTIAPRPPHSTICIPTEAHHPALRVELRCAVGFAKLTIAPPADQISQPLVHGRLRMRLTTAPLRAKCTVDVAKEQPIPARKPSLSGV